MTRFGAVLCVVAVAALASPASSQELAPPNGVELKRAIEQHYAEKVVNLLAPSFAQRPVVSVEVELDLNSVRNVAEKTTDAGRTIETVVRTPGAIVRRSIAVAVPAEELPVGFGLSSWRTLIERGLALGPNDKLEIAPMPFAPRPLPASTPGPDGWDRLRTVLPAIGHVLWAAVALVLGALGWNAARRFADREPAPLAALAPPPTAAIATREPELVAATPAPAAARPRRMGDPVSAVRRAAERDPARVADALRGWLQP